MSTKTNVRKVWKITNKIKGKSNKETIKCLKVDGNVLTEEKEFANTLAKSFHLNSSSANYSSEFRIVKNHAESKLCFFPADKTLNYNLPFTPTE